MALDTLERGVHPVAGTRGGTPLFRPGGMPRQGPVQIAFAVDSGQRLGTTHLTSPERRELEQLPTERRKRQFAIGRVAARAAVRQYLQDGDCPSVEIVNEPECAPRLALDGRTDRAGISISHSSRLAVACVWSLTSAHLLAAGVDVEHVRPNQVSESTYAFSRRERKLLARLPEKPEILGLAGWTVKEAVWKALRASQSIGPDAIDIYALSLGQGYAVVKVKGLLAHHLGAAQLSVTTEIIPGPDGRYVLSLARVLA